MLSALESFRLFVVDAIGAGARALKAGAIGLGKNVVSLDARAESACAWNWLALLLALRSIFLSEEHLGSGIHALRSRSTDWRRLLVVVEGFGICLEVLLLHERVGLLLRCSEEVVNGGSRNRLKALKALQVRFEFI